MKRDPRGYVILEEQYTLNQLQEFDKAGLRPAVCFRVENPAASRSTAEGNHHRETIFCCNGESDCFYCNGAGYRKDIFEAHRIGRYPIILVGIRIKE